jgi:DNA-binding MarR family transcriptional regulator
LNPEDPRETGDADPSRRALANVLGALALVVSDEVGRRVLAATGAPSITDASTVSALGQFLDGATIDRVHQVLGVTPSGAVRLIDRLTEADLVSREPGPDKRSRAVRLTDLGHRQSRTVGAARSDYLLALTADLSAAEVTTLRTLLGRVMAAVVSHKDGGAWTCRLCDLDACRRSLGECPTHNAAVARHGD